MALYFANHLLSKFRPFLFAEFLFQFFLRYWRGIIVGLCRGNRVVNRIRGVVELPGFQRDIDNSARGHVHEHVRFNRRFALCSWRFDLLDNGVVRVRLVGLCEKVVAVTQSDSSDGIPFWELHEDRVMWLSRNRIWVGQRCNTRLGGAGRLYTSGL